LCVGADVEIWRIVAVLACAFAAMASRRGFAFEEGLFDAADEDCVVAAFVLREPGAAQGDGGCWQMGKAVLIFDEASIGELVDATGSEAHREVCVLRADDVDAPVLRSVKDRVALSVVGEADKNQGRVDGDRGEGSGGESPPTALGVGGGHDRDSGGEGSHGLLKDVFASQEFSHEVSLSRRSWFIRVRLVVR
jgi:hypothetical protein